MDLCIARGNYLGIFLTFGLLSNHVGASCELLMSKPPNVWIVRLMSESKVGFVCHNQKILQWYVFWYFCLFDNKILKLTEPTDTPKPGPVFCLLLGVNSDYAQPIRGQVSEVTCPVNGRAQPELTPSKRGKQVQNSVGFHCWSCVMLRRFLACGQL